MSWYSCSAVDLDTGEAIVTNKKIKMILSVTTRLVAFW